MKDITINSLESLKLYAIDSIFYCDHLVRDILKARKELDKIQHLKGSEDPDALDVALRAKDILSDCRKLLDETINSCGRTKEAARNYMTEGRE